jgi:hypothetical protein
VTDINTTLRAFEEEVLPRLAVQLAPGRSEEEIDAVEAKFGHRLPDDVRALYRWRDGSGMRSPDRQTWLAPLRGLLGLDHILSEAAELRVFAQWPNDCVPVLVDGAGGNGLGVRCSDGAVFDLRDSRDDGAVVAASLGEWLGGVLARYREGTLIADSEGAPDEDLTGNLGPADRAWIAAASAEFDLPVEWVTKRYAVALTGRGSSLETQTSMRWTLQAKGKQPRFRELIWKDYPR